MSSEHAIVLEHTKLVERLVKRYAKSGIESDDLMQEAFIGLIKAHRAWIPDGGAAFKTFATTYIANALWAVWSRDRRQGMTGGKKFKQAHVTSMDAVNEDGDTLHDSLGTCAEQETLYAAAEMEQLLRTSLGKLSERDRLILKARYEDERPLTEIGEELGLTKQRVQQLEVEAVKRLSRVKKDAA